VSENRLKQTLANITASHSGPLPLSNCQALDMDIALPAVSLPIVTLAQFIKMAAVGLRNAAHAEEKAEVEVLSADAVKYGELAKKLRALQASLEGGGRTVRAAIGPVHSNTREHQVMIHSMCSVLL